MRGRPRDGTPLLSLLSGDACGVHGSEAIVVSEVAHQARVEVNETGTAAAAATAVVRARSRGIPPSLQTGLRRLGHGSLLLAGILATACARQQAEPPVPPADAGAPVILISIDTLRADHLPVYGYRGVRTPAIDALRRDGILFENAYSHCPMTLPSHLSVLTGLLPY